MKCVAIIPARQGSQRVLNKNFRPINGRSLVDRTVTFAVESGLFDRVIISTDNTEYALPDGCDDAKILIRSDENSGEHAVAAGVIAEVLTREGISDDLVFYLQPTSPLRRVEDVSSALRMLEAGANNVITVTELPAPLDWCFSDACEASFQNFMSSMHNKRSQDLPRSFYLNGLLFAFRASKFLATGTHLYSEGAAYLEVPLDRAVDIDTEEDFQRAEALLHVIER